MPVNITKGNSAQFIVEFVDASGNTTVPAGGEIDITYTSGITTATQVLTLVANQSFFTATWQSSVADYGPGYWQVYAAGSTTVAASSGDIRVMDTTA